MMKHLQKNKLLIVICLLFFAAVANRFLQPGLYGRRIDDNTVVIYPLFLYGNNPSLFVLTISVVIALLIIWGCTHPMSRDAKVAVTIFILLGSGMFGCLVGFSSGDSDIDIIGMQSEVFSHETVKSGSHTYHLAIVKGIFGLSGAVVFNCDALGIVCRAVHVESEGSEGNVMVLDLHFRPHPNGIDLIYHDDVLFEHRANQSQ
jgi:hypothetical protein